MTPKPTGFAALPADRLRAICSSGGKRAHAIGSAHTFTPEQAREAGRKGGVSVSQDRRHMSSIGSKGGAKVSQDRAHMAAIARLGGTAKARKTASEVG